MAGRANIVACTVIINHALPRDTSSCRRLTIDRSMLLTSLRPISVVLCWQFFQPGGCPHSLVMLGGWLVKVSAGLDSLFLHRFTAATMRKKRKAIRSRRTRRCSGRQSRRHPWEARESGKGEEERAREIQRFLVRFLVPLDLKVFCITFFGE